MIITSAKTGMSLEGTLPRLGLPRPDFPRRCVPESDREWLTAVYGGGCIASPLWSCLSKSPTVPSYPPTMWKKSLLARRMWQGLG